MKKHRIAWLPGDGIGAEVLEAAEIVLNRIELRNKTTGKTFPVVALPKSRQAIIDAGGLIAHTRNRPLQTNPMN